MLAVLFHSLLLASLSDAIRLETIVMKLQVHFRESDMNGTFVNGDMCSTFDRLSATVYYAFSKAVLYCNTLELYSNSFFSIRGRIAVYIQQTHVRSSTLGTWNAHIREFLIPYLNSKIYFAGAEDSSSIAVENVDLRATEVLSIGGSVNAGDMKSAALNHAVRTQLHRTFTKADYAPFLIGFSPLSRAVFGSWGTVRFFADYAHMVGVDVDLCSPIMLDRLTGKLNRHMTDGSNGGMVEPITVTHLRPNMFPFSICDVEKVEMVSIVLELDCPVNTEPRSQVIIKSTVEKVRKALDDHPVREIRFQKDDSNKSDLLIVVYMDPEKFLNLSKSYGQSDLLDNTFEDTLNERLAALSPSRVNPIACTQDRIYLQAHGICPKGGEFVFIGQNSTSTKLSVCLWSAPMLLLITCCWR